MGATSTKKYLPTTDMEERKLERIAVHKYRLFSDSIPDNREIKQIRPGNKAVGHLELEPGCRAASGVL